MDESTKGTALLAAAMERIAVNAYRAALQALREGTREFALTGHWQPESQRVAYLFGKAYWWDREPDGRLALQPAAWINAPALREQLAAAHRRPGTDLA